MTRSQPRAREPPVPASSWSMPLAILDSRLAEVRTVTDEQVAEAILLLLERSKLLVEGAGAAALAALMSGAKPKGTTCVILSGGNIDPSVLLSVTRAGLTRAGRYL